MKFFILAWISCVMSVLTFAQNVGINNDGSSPNSKAILDLKSDSKGLLVPRMTRADRDAMGTTNVPTGLLIYQTNERPGFYFNTNQLTTNWVALGKTRDTILIGSEAFFPRQSSTGYSTGALHARYVSTAASTQSLLAPLLIPSGSSIRKVIFYYYDDNASSNLDFEITPLSLDVGSTYSDPDLSVSSAGSASGVRTLSLSLDYLVKGYDYSYMITVKPTNGWSGSNDMGIKNVMVVYER